MWVAYFGGGAVVAPLLSSLSKGFSGSSSRAVGGSSLSYKSLGVSEEVARARLGQDKGFAAAGEKTSLL